MQTDVAEQLSHDAKPPRRYKPRGALKLAFIDRVDGRSAIAKRVSEIARVFTAALGGADQLTPAQALAVHNAAVLSVIAEDAQARVLAGSNTVKLDDAIRASSAARRAVSDLGLPAPPPPAQSSLTVASLEAPAGVAAQKA
jgi:hypothetical protein